jgi:Coenzyme PQQ synthesis protein D (PqqD)
MKGHARMATPAIALTTTIVRDRDQLTGDIDREIVLLSLDRGQYYQLKGAGSRVWELVETPTTVAAVIDRLLEEFDVDGAHCQQQVVAFLSNLHAEGLIQVVSAEGDLAGSP